MYVLLGHVHEYQTGHVDFVQMCVQQVTSTCCNACRGVFMNYRSRLPYHPAYQVENAVNEGGGSLCYAISGLLCWFQVSPALNQQ